MPSARPKSLTTVAATAALLCAPFALGACGGGDSSTTAAGTGTSAGTKASAADRPTPTSGCGSYSLGAPPDPQGILAKLGSTYQDAFAGSKVPIEASAWANWKPSHPAPYTVGIQWATETNDFAREQTQQLQSILKASPLVGDVIYQSTGGTIDVGQEIQGFNSLIQKKPDIIILEPLTGEAFVASVKRAADAGIPVISAMAALPSKYAVAVHPNDQANGAITMSKLTQITGGKGNVFLMHAIPGETGELNTQAAAKAVRDKCPEMKVIGEAYGGYNPAQAKSETLKFLATHPQKVDAVFQTATMAPGIMGAFQQTGRPMPPVNDIGNAKGSLGYWAANRDSYEGVGAGLGAKAAAQALAGVALRMLDGQGVKVTDIQHPNTLITDKNLSDWADPSWTLTTPGIAEGPADQFMDDAFLNGLFNNGKTPPTG